MVCAYIIEPGQSRYLKCIRRKTYCRINITFEVEAKESPSKGHRKVDFEGDIETIHDGFLDLQYFYKKTNKHTQGK